MNIDKTKNTETIVQIIRLNSSLSEKEVLAVAREREEAFRAIPGLVQKYYVKADKPGEYAGIYIWDSRESLEAYRSSELAAGISAAYELIEKPDIEVLDLLFQLRN